jgi:AcrR family transcriptional regulator
MKTKTNSSGAGRPAKQPATHGLRVGGRSGRVVANVLRAATAELARRGYTSFRVEDVASAAGVNKTTVYRRWPTKADLVSAAIRETVMHMQAGPDTGSIQGDLMELLRRVVAWKQTAETASVLRMLVAEAADPEVERIGRMLRAEAFEPWLAVVMRGKARGEIPAGADPRLLVEMVFTPVMARLHRLHEPVDEATRASIVGIVLAGVRETTPGDGAPRSKSRRRMSLR